MAGLEIRIPYVNFKTLLKYQTRYNAPATDITIQLNFQYMGNKIMFTPSIEPLNSVSDVSWGIIDGSTYATINSSTGELTINENTITQMVKVRAQSKTNPNLYDDREIVLTYKEPEAIEEITFDISVNGLSSEYIFADTSTSYNFTAQLDPSLNGYTVVYDIIEGYDTFYVTDMNFDNNITTTTFSFYPPELEDQIISLHLYVDKIPDISTDVQFTVRTLLSEILFDNIPEAPYIPYTLYSFDYYTEPVVNFRNLDVSVITGSEYLYNYYKGEEEGTKGKFYFERNSLEPEDPVYVTIRFSDPLDNTIYNDVSVMFDYINHHIDVSGNKAIYQYNEDKTVYESFTWTETPNYDRELQVIVTLNPDNIIEYNTTDVSGGNGTFNFQTKYITDEGKVTVRILDPLTLTGKTVAFDISNNKVIRGVNMMEELIRETNINDVKYTNTVMENVSCNVNNNNVYIDNYEYAYPESTSSPDYIVTPRRKYSLYTDISTNKVITGTTTYYAYLYIEKANLTDTSIYMEYNYNLNNVDTSIARYRIANGGAARTYNSGNFWCNVPLVNYILSNGKIIYSDAYRGNKRYMPEITIKTVVSSDHHNGNITGSVRPGTYITKRRSILWNQAADNSPLISLNIFGGMNNLILYKPGPGAAGYIDYRGTKQVCYDSSVYTDIPRIKADGWYMHGEIYYLDPDINRVSAFFNNVENKEIHIDFRDHALLLGQDSEYYHLTNSEWSHNINIGGYYRKDEWIFSYGSDYEYKNGQELKLGHLYYCPLYINYLTYLNVSPSNFKYYVGGVGGIDDSPGIRTTNLKDGLVVTTTNSSTGFTGYSLAETPGTSYNFKYNITVEELPQINFTIHLKINYI